MMKRVVVGVAFIGLLAPARAAAQTRECELVSPSDFSRTETPQGEFIQFRSPVRFRCTGGVTVRADRAVSIGWTRELQLQGNAFYEDPERRITGDFLNHVGSQNRLTGNGNVVVTDLRNNSVIRGETLLHDFERPGVEAHTLVQGGKPHATVRSRARTPGRADAPPLEVDADYFDITGNRVFKAYGNVRFTRGDMRGSSREVEFDQSGERVVLRGAGVLENDRYKLIGEEIEAHTDGEVLRNVTSRRSAQLTARGIDARGRELRLFFDEGRINRLVSLGVLDAGPQGERAVANSEGFNLVADSIDAEAPGEALERVVAVGDAYGERTPDTLDVSLPEIAQRDWLRGDTITAFFAADTAAERTRAPGDTARATRVLERVLAVSPGGAQSIHRIAQSGAAGASVNYLIARRIDVHLDHGKVVDVVAEGDIRGIHLQPRAQASAAGGRP